MNLIISIIRTLFRHRWLILIGTTLFTLLVIYYTRHMRGGYDVKATLYTGVASGYNLESDKRTDWQPYRTPWTTSSVSCRPKVR